MRKKKNTTIRNKIQTQITDVGDAVWSHQWTPTDSTLLLKTLNDVDTTRLVMIDINRTPNINILNIRDRYASWMTKKPDNILSPVNYSNVPKIKSENKYSFFKHIKHFISYMLINLFFLI